jgi:hypothetical protein
VPGAVIGSSSGAYRSNRSSTLAPDARLALPFLADTGGSLERPPKQLTAAMLVLSCCERDSAENMPPRRVRSVGGRARGEREERATKVRARRSRVSAEGTEKEKRNRVEEIFAGACSRYF